MAKNYYFENFENSMEQSLIDDLVIESIRIFGVDYNKYFSFKHKYNHLLRNRPKGKELQTHWSNQKKEPIYSN